MVTAHHRRSRPRPKAYFAIHRVADHHASAIRQAVVGAIVQARSHIPQLDLRRPDLAEHLPWRQMQITMFPPIRRAVLAAMRGGHRVAAGGMVKKQVDPWLELLRSLLLTNPRAEKWASERAADLVIEITESSRQAIRQVIRQMFEQGIPADKAARLLREFLGLTPRQAQAVENFRRALEDQQAQRLADGKALQPVERLDDMTFRYSARLLAQRADLIARTESLAASNQGQQVLWQEAADRGLLERDRTARIWIVTPDERLCPYCEPLGDADPVPLDQPFETGLGTVMGPPLHPDCRCTTGLVFADEEGHFSRL